MSRAVSAAKFLDRHALVLAAVTLDGQPARVSGIRNDSATVTAAHTGLTVTVAWNDVARGVSRDGGAFHTR